MTNTAKPQVRIDPAKSLVFHELAMTIAGRCGERGHPVDIHHAESALAYVMEMTWSSLDDAQRTLSADFDDLTTLFESAVSMLAHSHQVTERLADNPCSRVSPAGFSDLLSAVAGISLLTVANQPEPSATPLGIVSAHALELLGRGCSDVSWRVSPDDDAHEDTPDDRSDDRAPSNPDRKLDLFYNVEPRALALCACACNWALSGIDAGWLTGISGTTAQRREHTAALAAQLTFLIAWLDEYDPTDSRYWLYELMD